MSEKLPSPRFLPTRLGGSGQPEVISEIGTWESPTRGLRGTNSLGLILWRP